MPVHPRRSILSLNMQSEMNRGFVTNTQRMGKPVRKFRPRCTNCMAQRLSKEILARNRLNRNELVHVRLFQGCAQPLLINPLCLTGDIFTVLTHDGVSNANWLNQASVGILPELSGPANTPIEQVAATPTCWLAIRPLAAVEAR